MRARSCLPGVILAAALGVAEVQAAPEPSDAPSDAPGQHASDHVIPPGREQAARELLDGVVARMPADLRWLGPTIEFDRIKWWLMQGEQAHAMLVLVPREQAELDEPTSQSFAIRVAWPPEREVDPRERELLDAAVDAIQAGDRGQFYLVRFDLFEDDGAPLPAPYVAKLEVDREGVRRRWALELGGVLLLSLLAVGVTLRRRSR